MPATVNITPTAPSDGALYANAVPLTFTEATLGGGTGANPDPIPITFGQTIVAVVQLTINGLIVGNNSYVVMQTDLADGVWVDVVWIVWSGSQGTATFVVSAGGNGAINNAFQQSRQSNQAPQPQANGSNALPLGGRIRFVGKATAVGGSSSLAGVGTAVSATIRYKVMGLR